MMMIFNGRVVGISGIIFQLSRPRQKPSWQLTFIIGLLLSGFLYNQFTGESFPEAVGSWKLALIGGLLVGVGTRLGSGCTSGHGVCGISRFSPRSMVATVTFIAAGMITVSLFSVLTQ
ncbi:MAG: YeeE/YedE family protein [Pseudomonadales bacterium]|nr:YeeE/YedE family protein [Pseudomonadales bacterium]